MPARSLALISALSILGGATLAFVGLEGSLGGVPRFVELALWAQLFFFLVWRLVTLPRSVERAAELGSVAFGLGIFWTLRVPSIFWGESAGRARARAAGFFSTTGWFELPYVALASGLGLLALAATSGLLLREWLQMSPSPRTQRSATALGWTAACGVFVFGSLALLGYATGSWSLLAE